MWSLLPAEVAAGGVTLDSAATTSHHQHHRGGTSATSVPHNMATATLLYTAVPVINQNTSSRGCSCNQTTPELLKKISSVLQQEGTPAATQQSSWSRRKERSTTRARRQLHYPAQEEEEDRSQEEAQEAEHWLGVGRDLRCLADSLAGVPGAAQRGTQLDLSSASSLVYSLLVLALIRRLSRAAGFDFKHLF